MDDDIVTDYQNTILFQAQPSDVKDWLNQPGNMGDTTQVVYNDEAPAPFGGTICYATEYLRNWDAVYGTTG
jgi:hypothetical protein